jgi:hypothetical protein
VYRAPFSDKVYRKMKAKNEKAGMACVHFESKRGEHASKFSFQMDILVDMGMMQALGFRCEKTLLFPLPYWVSKPF